MEVRRYWRGKLWQIVCYNESGVRVILNQTHERVRDINNRAHRPPPPTPGGEYVAQPIYQFNRKEY